MGSIALAATESLSVFSNGTRPMTRSPQPYWRRHKRPRRAYACPFPTSCNGFFHFESVHYVEMRRIFCFYRPALIPAACTPAPAARTSDDRCRQSGSVRHNTPDGCAAGRPSAAAAPVAPIRSLRTISLASGADSGGRRNLCYLLCRTLVGPKILRTRA